MPVETLLEDEYVVSPLRRHALPPITDGAAAIVLAAGDKAGPMVEEPGVDHRVRPPDGDPLARSPRPHRRRRRRPRPPTWPAWPTARIDVAEIHAPFAHQEIIVREALGLDDTVAINPSGGPLAANPLMSAGLIRIGEAAARIPSGQAHRAVAHATSGPCLQQNLVCVLEGA